MMVRVSLRIFIKCSMSQILVYRLVLNLRQAGSRSVSDGARTMPELVFASTRFLGNIGAPLEPPDFVGAENETTEHHIEATIQQQIDNPLSIGILDMPRACDARYVLNK